MHQVLKSLMIGDYIEKVNFGIFGKHTENVPAIKIKKIRAHKRKGNRVVINDTIEATFDSVRVISKEEADRINDIYENFSIADCLRPDFNSSCTREDNGNPKEPLAISTAKKVLYRFNRQNPNGGYEIYRCKSCGNLHIGKSIKTI